MYRPPIPGMTTKERLIARSRDRLTRFSLQNNTIRGAFVRAPLLVQEMQLAHQLGLMETMILGQAYLAGLLISSTLKGDERIALQLECDGPLKGLNVEASSRGEVRGYLNNPDLSIQRPLESFDFAPFIGRGTLVLRRYLPDAKTPYTGLVPIVYGNLAADLALYYTDSEQTPSAFNLSVRFDGSGHPAGCAGLMIQAMPGADPDDLDSLSQLLHEMPSLGKALGDTDPKTFITGLFSDYQPRILGDSRVEFFCHCSQEIFQKMMTTLPAEELDAMLTEETFPMETRCRNCNTPYQIEKEDVDTILQRKMN